MKTQMKFQKILTLVSLIVAALTLVLGVFFSSGILEKIRFYHSEVFKSNPETGEPLPKDPIGADALYSYSQHMNDVFVVMAIVLILVVAVLYITATNSRRNYYITNYVAIGLVVAYTFAFALFLMIMCGTCISYAGKIDVALWKEYSTKFNMGYSQNYATIVLGFIMAVLLLVEVAAWVLNLIWKIKLMQGEKKLLAGDFAKEVA